jgi:hypothetical protein
LIAIAGLIGAIAGLYLLNLNQVKTQANPLPAKEIITDTDADRSSPPHP